jgi:two-component system, chemotaxis family, CheB/CheR fusion protein
VADTGQGQEPSFIVGVGASAGGVEALQGLFRALPSGSGMGFVVVTHLAPGQVSVLDEILRRAAAIRVVRAEDGALVRADEAHVAAPDSVVTLERGRLRVRPADPLRRERHPVDVFLASLAEDRGERAVAVILSGSGTDGALGVKAVKEGGGLAVAQGGDGAAPRHKGMPASAVSTGLVDMVVPVEDIPGRLAEYARGFDALAALTDATGRRGNGRVAELRAAICDILRHQLGHDFAGYKERTFMRRVQRRMQVLQVHELGDYVERLRREPGEVAMLFRDLLISVTDFFRDEDAFAALRTHVIPRIFEGKGAGDTVRAWVPGCATGEEVLSLAILMREHMDGLDASPKVQLFATDIDDPALDVARTARYPASLLRGMGPERVERFFTEENGVYAVTKQVRDMCVFSSHSVIRDPPFSRVDLVSCRNLLIYLDAETQSRVIPVFHYALRPGGFLFLGSAEGVSQHGGLFAPVDKQNRIFRRRELPPSAARPPLFVPGVRFPTTTAGAGPAPGTGAAGGLPLRRAAEARVLERWAPAHVVVDREGEVVHFSPRTGRYLEPAAGQPSRQLVAMARGGLRLDLRAALQRAVETGAVAAAERVEVEIEDGRIQLVDLTVEPMPPRADGEQLYLVLFADRGPSLSREEMEAQDRASADEARASRASADRELVETRERLQATIEEYETALEELKSANEEMTSVNEELQSTNEELETSKEEVQSVNEELHTINQELSNKIDQLNLINTDLKNLYESTRIALIFLDRQLVIRNFTPAVTELFSLIPADRGRPLADLSGNLDYEDLQRDAQAVLAGGEPIERRVSRRDDRAHYMVRVLPYRSGEGAVEGAIITFVDMTGMAEAERRQRTLVHELNHRVRNMLTVVIALASQTLRRTPAPEAFAEAFRGRIEALARAYGLVAHEQWGDVRLGDVVREELEPHLLDGGADRIEIRGDAAVMLDPKQAVALGMVLHELATNAVKYGSLSAAEGRLAVSWGVEERGDGRRLVLRGAESGGPPVGEPAARGFGSELIEREIGHELDGEAGMEFAPEGLRATFSVPWR